MRVRDVLKALENVDPDKQVFLLDNMERVSLAIRVSEEKLVDHHIFPGRKVLMEEGTGHYYQRGFTEVVIIREDAN